MSSSTPCRALTTRAARRRQLRVLGQRLADGDERRGLGEAVDLRDVPAELALDPLDRRRRRRRAGGEDAHPAGTVAARLRRRVRERDEHRGRRAHQGHLLVPDQLEDRRRLDPAQADVGARGRRDGPREGPAVRVEHRQRPQVALADRHRHVQQRADRRSSRRCGG